MKTFEVVERGTVYSDTAPHSEQHVACYPTLARLSDGRLLCTFRIGKTKSGADESIRIAQSHDEGHTWQLLDFAPDATLRGVPGSLAVGSLVETAPGQLLLIASWINRSDPTLPISHPETSGCLELRTVKFHSADGGATWSEIEELSPPPFPQPEVSGPVIALSKPGHLLLPMENQKEFNDPNPIDEKAYARLSFDGGRTWPEWAMIAHDPARKFWCNRVARLPESAKSESGKPESGKLVCVSWAFDNATEQDLPLHLVYGSPDGRKWEPPFSTGICGQVSALLPFDENTLLMSTSHRESPAAIRLRTSEDGGHSWDGEGLLVFDAENQASHSGGDLGEYYDLMTNYTFGWSPMVKLGDGSVLMTYFAGTPEAISVYWARIAQSR